MYQSFEEKLSWIEKFTPLTIEQYKIYQFIQQHFLPDNIQVEAVARNRLKITDINESMELGIEDIDVKENK